MLQAQDLHKSFHNVSVLKGISLHIANGEIVALTGPSGAGKSTLMHLLGTLDKADKGTIHIDGKRIDHLSDRKLNKWRNKKIGFIFQFHHLLPEFTALENICLPAWIGGMNKKNAYQKGMALLEKVGLSHKAMQKPSTLSGGEQQRIAVARALINQPSIILADEPSGNLDQANAQQLHHLFERLNKEEKQSFLIVTHNEKIVQRCHRVLRMEDGQLL